MIKLNFKNVEELIFYDTSLQNLLSPDHFSIFEQWRMGQRIPYLKEIGKQAILDFLNTITEADVQVLETFFDDKIIVEKLNYSIVLDMKVPLSDEKELCEQLCNVEGFNYVSTWRDAEFLYLSFWK